GGTATDRVRGDLRERRGVPLPLRGQAGGDENLAARLDANVRAFVRADPGALDVAAEAQPEIPAGPARFGLSPAKVRDTDHLGCHREPGRIVTAVVAGGGAVLEGQSDVPGELVRLHEVAAPDLGRLEPELTRDQADRALHDKGAVRAPRSSVRGDRGLVGIGDLEVDRVVRQTVGPGQ